MKTIEKTRKLLSRIFAPNPMPVEIGNRTIRIFVRSIGWAVLALLPVYCLFMTEYINYANKERALRFFLERTSVVVFDLCLLYLIWLCLLCIVKKGWVAGLVYSGIFGLASCVNYLKYAMTGDHFYPWDLLQQAGNVGELTSFITVPFPVLYGILIFFGLFQAVPLFFSGVSLQLKWNVRIPLLALLIGCTVFSLSTPEKVTAMLNRSSLYLEDMALQDSNYSANGFVGAFTINVLSTNIQKPDDYSADMIDALMEPYEDQPMAEDFSSPDIILILSESFWDPTLLNGTSFSSDPLAGYRALCQEENVISGRFFTTGYGGGTVRPEFEVLTGLSTDYLPSGCVPWQYIAEESDSYIQIYDELGYNTMAIHPYTSSFYNRKNSYPLIGFGSLHFEDDIYALESEIEVKIKGKQISDETFADSIQYYMDHATDDSPMFVFGISMENHQPYPDKYEQAEITVENSAFDGDVLNAVTNFTQGAAHADQCLTDLAQYVESRERDTILIWFGDHLPTLGSDFGAYKQSGAVGENGTFDQGDYEYLYSTPFLIYANFDMKESSMLHAGSDNDIASYNLMNAVAELIGAPRSAYMEYLKAYNQAIPYYNIRLRSTPSEEAKAYINGHKLLTYDRIAGAGYSLK